MHHIIGNCLLLLSLVLIDKIGYSAKKLQSSI